MNELFTEIPELTALLRATIAVQRDKLEAANRAYAWKLRTSRSSATKLHESVQLLRTIWATRSSSRC